MIIETSNLFFVCLQLQIRCLLLYLYKFVSHSFIWTMQQLKFPILLMLCQFNALEYKTKNRIWLIYRNVSRELIYMHLIHNRKIFFIFSCIFPENVLSENVILLSISTQNRTRMCAEMFSLYTKIHLYHSNHSSLVSYIAKKLSLTSSALCTFYFFYALIHNQTLQHRQTVARVQYFPNIPIQLAFGRCTLCTLLSGVCSMKFTLCG